MAQVRSLKTGIKFKDTPIGKVPVDWEVSRLGDLCVGKPEYGANVSAIDRDENLPRYVRITDITDDGYLLNETWQSINRNVAKAYMLKTGDLLFARSGATVGKTYLYRKKDGECAFAGYLIRFIPNAARLLPELLFQFTHSNSYYQWVKGMLRAGAQPNINGKEYSDLIIPIPPLPEQKKIAEILSNVDDAIEETDRIIEKTKELKKSLMQKLLTRGVGHKKFKKTEIGEISDDWAVGQVTDYGEIITGSTPNTAVKEFYGSDYPFVSPFDLGMVKVIKSSKKYLSERGATVARLLPVNSVLFVCIGSTIGKTGIAGTQLATNQQINSVICKKNNYDFVYYYLTFISNKIRKLAGTQAVPIVNKSLFGSVAVAIPKINEQKRISNILSSVDSELENEERKKQELEALKKSLMQVLLTGKIRVKVA